MVVMALDHANGFIAHGKYAPEMWIGLFPDYRGDALAFLTRLVTHLAAPGFFFLMGAGMALLVRSRQAGGWSRRRIVRHFLQRGALLIALQLLVENPAWAFGGTQIPGIYFGVLYGLGGAMILGVLLVLLPGRWLLPLSAALVLATEALLKAVATSYVGTSVGWRLLLVPGFAPEMTVLYPVLPWLGVAGLGMAYGRWLGADRTRALRWSTGLGAAALLAFLILRLLDGYGNIHPTPGDGWINLLNTVKYPPSLTFLLMTLGVNGLALGLLARLPGRAGRALQPLVIFGRAPLVFYLAHLYLYGLMGRLIDPKGIGIPAMIPLWLLGLVILLPLCWFYGRFKHSRPPDSPWRLL